MSSRGFAAALVLAAAAGCASSPASVPPRAEAPASQTDVEVRDRGGAWSSDPRWKARVAAVAAACDAAVSRTGEETGLSFERGRGPLVEFDEAAAADGDVTLRFVDGVRRPVLRLAPRALLSGEFRAQDDLAPLVVRAAILMRAGEHEPPGWVVAGVPVLAAGAFERRVRRAALGGTEVLSEAADLFGPLASDPLAGAARAKALARTSRSERPLARFLEVLCDGKSEEAALAEIGITRPDFLDAAADTERDRAARAVSGDPVFPALAAARAALGRGETDAADAALARVAESLGDDGGDPWVAADARLCLARVALSRGETKAAGAAYGAAVASGRVVRVREERILGACLAPDAERGAALRELVKDFPDAAADAAVARVLAIPAPVASRHPGTASDLLSSDAAKRRSAAAHLGESGGKEAAGALRLLAADGDASVRRAAIAALAVALGGAADAEIEAATRDADASVRRTALDLLAVSDRARAAKCAARMKDDADASVRARAAELSGGR